MNMFKYLFTMGPRRMAGLSSPVSMPMDMALQAVAFGRQDGLVGRGHGRLVGGQAEHAWNTRSQDVGIDQSDASPDLLQGQGQVHADRGFSDAAFAAAYGDDVGDAGQLFRYRARRDLLARGDGDGRVARG